jgi:hypothetical protein
MTPQAFRKLALSLPDAIESAHGGHPDFRVGKTIFATLGYPDQTFAMIKLTPDQQALFIELAPGMFVPVKGGWGLRGATHVRLAAADAARVKRALTAAWEHIAGKKPAGARKVAGKAAAAPVKPAARPGKALSRLRAALRALKVDGLEEGTSHGMPSFKVRRKFLTRVKDADTYVFRCPLEEKEMLIEAAPEIYFETDHYKGWPAILVRASRASDQELQICLQRALRLVAAKRSHRRAG